MNLAMLSDLAGKKDCKLSPVRVDERVAAAIDELMAAHGGKSKLDFAEYVRGLIYIDALLSGALAEDADIPHWVRRSYPQLLRRDDARERPKPRGPKP